MELENIILSEVSQVQKAKKQVMIRRGHIPEEDKRRKLRR
jgi:hypothetical protein